MYLGFYVGALTNLDEIRQLFVEYGLDSRLWLIVMTTAALLIPVRAFLICGTLFRAPRMQEHYLRAWWALMIFDCGWALSPFLLLHHIQYGLAVACMAPLVYAPFAQRSLMLMGAASQPRPEVEADLGLL
ncbi:hypothetical protein GCM10011586_32500 [Silvibacterium dinghuense]|nr:hypothetical protein GCM10011586_32500 [Silvibacterium dinghuense]